MCRFGECRLTDRMQAVGGNPADAADARGLDVSIATALNTHFTSIPDVKCLREKGDSIKNVLTCENPLRRTSSPGRESESWMFLTPPTHIQI